MSEGRRRGYVILELIIVTTGILIALSIDGARGWLADRRLLAEARANLTTEIRGNIEQLRGFMRSSEDHAAKLTAARDVIREVLDGEPLRTNTLNVGVEFPSLSSTSRRSTQKPPNGTAEARITTIVRPRFQPWLSRIRSTSTR